MKTTTTATITMIKFKRTKKNNNNEQKARTNTNTDHHNKKQQPNENRTTNNKKISKHIQRAFKSIYIHMYVLSFMYVCLAHCCAYENQHDWYKRTYTIHAFGYMCMFFFFFRLNRSCTRTHTVDWNISYTNTLFFHDQTLAKYSCFCLILFWLQSVSNTCTFTSTQIKRQHKMNEEKTKKLAENATVSVK